MTTQPEWAPTWTYRDAVLKVDLGLPEVDYMAGLAVRSILDITAPTTTQVVIWTDESGGVFSLEFPDAPNSLTPEALEEPVIVLPSWGSQGQIFVSFGTYEPGVVTRSPARGEDDPVSLFYTPTGRIAGFQIDRPRETLADGANLNLVFE